jgi:hypothetical protein
LFRCGDRHISRFLFFSFSFGFSFSFAKHRLRPVPTSPATFRLPDDVPSSSRVKATTAESPRVVKTRRRWPGRPSLTLVAHDVRSAWGARIDSSPRRLQRSGAFRLVVHDVRSASGGRNEVWKSHAHRNAFRAWYGAVNGAQAVPTLHVSDSQRDWIRSGESGTCLPA